MALAHHRHKLSALMRRRIYMVRTMLALILIVLVFALIGGGNLFLQNSVDQKIYISESLKIEFVYPSGYTVDEALTTGTLKMDNKVLNYGKYGTIHNTALDHVNDFIIKNRVRVARVENVLDDAVLLESAAGNKINKAYYFVKDNFVYYLSTDNPSLFSDLDAIAQSFRIIP